MPGQAQAGSATPAPRLCVTMAPFGETHASESVAMTERVAIVTGGGSGIGRAAALALARVHASTVVIPDFNLAGAEETAQAVTALDRAALPLRVDVSDIPQVDALFERVVAEYGRVDILVNCAGICPLTPPDDITPQEWDRVLGINLKGMFFCCQKAMPVMRLQQWGRIINISSVAGKLGGLLSGVHYSASKGGVLAMTNALARHMAPYNVTVNAVCPGQTDTAMTADWTPESKEMFIRQVPLRRFGRPEEIAAAIVFLASEEASYITGEALDVNGGFLMD